MTAGLIDAQLRSEPGGGRWLRHLNRMTVVLVDNATKGRSWMSTASTTGVSRINRKEARVLASAEFERFAALTASLIPQEWATDTDCVGWDVRTMARRCRDN